MEILKHLLINTPFIDVVQQDLNYSEFMNDVLTNRKCVGNLVQGKYHQILKIKEASQYFILL